MPLTSLRNMNSGTLSSRINRQGWSVKHALEEPTGDIGRHGKQRPYDIFGRHELIEKLFGDCKTYPELAERMATYIEGLAQ